MSKTFKTDANFFRFKNQKANWQLYMNPDEDVELLEVPNHLKAQKELLEVTHRGLRYGQQRHAQASEKVERRRLDRAKDRRNHRQDVESMYEFD